MNNAELFEQNLPHKTVAEYKAEFTGFKVGIYFGIILTFVILILFSSTTRAFAEVTLFDTLQSTTNGGGAFGFARFGFPNNSEGPSRECQTIEIETSGILTNIEFYIETEGSPVEDVVVEVHDTDCDGSTLASGTLNNADISASMAVESITLDSPFAVVVSETYGIDFSTTGTHVYPDYFEISGDSGGTYSAGSIYRFGDGGVMSYDANGGDAEVRGFDNEGSEPPPTETSTSTEATSTIEQIQTNYGFSFLIFVLVFFGFAFYFKSGSTLK